MKRANELEFALGQRPEGATLQRWLYSELRAAVLSGRIAPGRRLPSSRDFARQQGISRGTVLAVYEQLIAEGYLAGTTGSGTIVSPALHIKPPPAAPAPAPVAGRLSAQGKLLAVSPFPHNELRLAVRPFHPNQPDLSAFPLATWRQLTNRYGRSRWGSELMYGDAAGYAPLRKAIAEHLHYSQRIACDASQVIIFSSVQQALDLTARLLLDPGDAALVEDPGYPGAARIFELAGAKVIGVPVDKQGLRTEPPLPIAPGIRLAYVTAAHQSPLGGSLPLDRRLALLEWAEACDAMIIEDDYDGEFRFDGQPLPALKSLECGERVIYMGSFSKLLFPSLRLAYMVVPGWMADAYRSAISLTCRHIPVVQQAVLSDFIAGGHFARHLHRMRLLYGERAQRFQQECKARFDGLLTVLPVSTGLDATVLLPGHANDSEVAAELNRNGIEARAISFYRLQHKAPSGLMMGFSAFDEPAMRKGMDGIEKVMDRLAPQLLRKPEA
jgi:GntR family transcriptional regulator/MocR family aminotransferase